MIYIDKDISFANNFLDWMYNVTRVFGIHNSCQLLKSNSSHSIFTKLGRNISAHDVSAKFNNQWITPDTIELWLLIGANMSEKALVMERERYLFEIYFAFNCIFSLFWPWKCHEWSNEYATAQKLLLWFIVKLAKLQFQHV